jgi:hypothetical protein
MTSLSDRLDTMVVQASAPGGGVHGELRGSDLTIYFSSGFYAQTGETAMAGRLEQLARLLWAERTRLHRQAIEEAGGWVNTRPENDEDVDFFDQRERLTATGHSADRQVSVTVRGMTSWTVTIAAGTLRSLSEAAFTQAVSIAAARLMTDQSQQIIALKGRVYGEPR